MQFILGLGALYAAGVKRHEVGTAKADRDALRQAGARAYQDTLPWDNTGYFADYHVDGRVPYGETVDLPVAAKIGAATTTSTIFSRWMEEDEGIFAPQRYSKLIQQRDMLQEHPSYNGWDHWNRQTLRLHS